MSNHSIQGQSTPHVVPILVWSACTLSLTAVGFAQKPSFDVASIKITSSHKDGGTIGLRGGRFIAENATLRTLVSYAYSPPSGPVWDQQIVGGPNWIQDDHFDIEAKGSEDVQPPSYESVRVMLQSLLEDRFGLKIRREVEELSVYNLLVAKRGPKLSEDQTPPEPRQAFTQFTTRQDALSPLPRGALRVINSPDLTVITGFAISVPRIVSVLRTKVDRLIVDNTHINGLLDVQIEFSPSQGMPPSDLGNERGQSLVAALQDMGLKFQSGKARLDVLVIEDAQHPTAN
jgi:uncharacterized protein (TIGR03435 family)